MIRETLINWLVINSILVADGNVQCTYRILPPQSIKQYKRTMRLADSLESQEQEDFLERRVVICLLKV